MRDISSIAHIVQERSQRGRQEFCAFQMQMRDATLDKSYNVACRQMRDSDPCVAKPILKEPTDERHVIDDGRFRQYALAAQVGLERLHLTLNRGQSAWRDLLFENDTFVTQKLEELSHCCGITLVDLHAASARPQVLGRMFGGDAAYTHAMLSEPAAKTRRE
jgi:hypothetical protein